MFLVILIALLSLPPALADGWDDFSNNLATDLAPFLALFGEQITKQYLSESVTKLDYFIFAMAPIGILTAVVSAIRVCGSPTLRAFVGRVQEGGGNSEAELCSSTSRDVCELYNNGGITRVLGRPKILEVVFDPEGYNYETGETGIHTFLDYVKHQKKRTTENGSDEDWIEEGENTKMMTGDSESLSRSPFVGRTPHHEPFAPNLSLNIGIKRRSTTVFWAVAVAGALLQTGVLVFAAVATYYLRWQKGEHQPESYAFPLTFVGTILLCFGTYFCASLVGERTVERVFNRKGQNPKSLKFCWIQPGGQIIGDQNFDAFCYIPRDTGFPRQYIISQKLSRDDQPRTEHYTWVAVGITVTGFVLQFTGLRALHSAIPVAQLGATMIMSMARTLLRMRHLTAGDNRLEKVPDQIIGHELDWLAFHIGEKVIKRDLKLKEDEEYKFFWRFCGMVERRNQLIRDPPNDSNAAKTLLAYRSRLADLTDSSANPVKSLSLTRSFRTEMVEVRHVAHQLLRAIKSTMHCLSDFFELQTQWKSADNRYWAFSTSLPSNANVGDPEHGDRQAKPKEHVLYLPLPDQNGEDRELNSMLEGILGLWVWSLKTDPVVEAEDQSGFTISRAAEVSTRRIMAVDIPTILYVENSCRVRFRISAENELDLSSHCPGPGTIWMTSGERGPKDDPTADCALPSCPCFRPSTAALSLDLGSEAPGCYRLFGWHALGMTLPQVVHIKKNSKLRVFLVDTNTPLVSLCAQEIFGSFFSNILNMVEKFKPRFDMTRRMDYDLNHKFIRQVMQIFTESGIGDTEDAALCVAPSYMSQFGLLAAKRAVVESKKQAIDLQGHGEWLEAQCVLRRVWQVCNISLYSEDNVQDQLYTKAALVTAMAVSLGELYRQAFMEETERHFSYKGIKWLNEQEINGLKGEFDELKEAQKAIARYDFVIMNDTHKENHIPIRDERTAILLRLTQSTPMTTEQRGEDLQTAAREDWYEIVGALLQLGVDPDFQDSDLRTALSYAAAAGATDTVDTLLARGANPNISDKHNRTPLFWAKHGGIIDQLLNSGIADPDARDDAGRTALHSAIMNGPQSHYEQRPIITRLLDWGKFNPDTKDNDGQTALCSAILKKGRPRTSLRRLAFNLGYDDIIRVLLHSGKFDPEAKGADGQTPLCCAAKVGDSLIVKLLLRMNEVNPNAKDDHGRTPLSWAVQEGHTNVVKLLLKTGKVDLDAKDEFGMTPLALGAQSSNQWINELLKAAKKSTAGAGGEEVGVA